VLLTVTSQSCRLLAQARLTPPGLAGLPLLLPPRLLAQTRLAAAAAAGAGRPRRLCSSALCRHLEPRRQVLPAAV
jgi:hypothetical protein